MEHKLPELLELDDHQARPLTELVTEKLSWLFEGHSARIIGSMYDPKHFGDAVVLLESDTMRIRVVRDRGQVTVWLAPPADPETFWGLISLSEVIEGHSVKPRYKLDVQAQLLRDSFPRLVEALGPRLSETRQEIERRQRERLATYERFFKK